MKYFDRPNTDNKVVLVLSVAEIQHIESAYTIAAHYFRQLADSEPEEWKADKYLMIANDFETYGSSYAEITAGEPRNESITLQREVLKIRTQNNK